MKLNEAQQKAIEHGDGPLLVLAGPGSGKTAVITRRILELTGKHQVRPGNILVITFTKAAALQMQERYEKLLQEAEKVSHAQVAHTQIAHTQVAHAQSSIVNFGTFHAVFFKILKYAYHFTAANIIKEEDSCQMLSEIIRRLDLELEDEKDFIEEVRGEISRIKSERLDISTYYSMSCPEEQFKQIYLAYDGEMRKRGLIDFDDMMLLCYELLTKRSDILSMWQDKYRYILIDEFQDINRLQYEIIRLLARPQDNLFIVGDDDQSIYRFRGAKPEIMLNFLNDYPQAGQVLLNYNYRSQANIVITAQNLISFNKKRFEKEILPTKEAGTPVRIQTFPTQEEEDEEIVSLIRHYHAEGMAYREMAVLFRTNTQARHLLGKLLSYNIPFQMRDKVPNLFEHWIARNIIAYLKLAKGSRERALVLQVMNRPNRYLSRELLTDATVDFEQWKRAYRDRDWMAERIEKLEYDLSLIARTNPYAAITYIRRAVGYDKYLEEYADYRRMRPEELLETMNELQESARGFDTCEEWFAYMEEYKQELERQKEQRERRDIDGVMLATMHSAKGLEYEAVILPDVNEGVVPYKKAQSEDEIEEERRMFYVALTRAKGRLSVFSVQQMHGKEMKVSRFVKEMRKTKQELCAGCRLRHVVYGEGTLTAREGAKLRILFDGLREEKVLDEETCFARGLLKVIAE
ncbi:MAG: ATP-dependent helicase [Lachnospiraceae bacterium]